ncbi:MAG: di-heme oxidoredictase family protein, partial [Verrucomicrobiota bacterium]
GKGTVIESASLFSANDSANLPDPIYGDQLQTRALPAVPAEADALVHYEIIHGAFADGEPYILRRPHYTITNLAYGPLATNILISPRVAPVVIGLGLLEAVPEETLRTLADPEDRDGDGISGRLNIVWDVVSKRPAIGRFGWKAEQPTVLQQVAGAFNGDMGLTTSLFPQENHTPAQAIRQPSGGSPEVSDEILHAVAFYSRTLAVPARRNWDDATVRRGQRIFHVLKCASCHVPELKTGDWPDLPELSHQTIRPYTDLLLHDLGEGLSDHRPVFTASGREWRTPPLWGIGLVEKVNGHTNFLQDGRARNLTEAILWHGGEAERSKGQFRALPKADRDALIAFLNSL